MANTASFNEETNDGATARGTALKTIGLCVAGWLIGYLISFVSFFLFFLLGRLSPEKPASTSLLWVTAIYGVVFAVAGALVGASFSRKHALGIGASIALSIGAMALWSWYQSPDLAHWTQLIAIFLMAPAAQFGALFRRLDY